MDIQISEKERKSNKNWRHKKLKNLMKQENPNPTHVSFMKFLLENFGDDF